MIFDIRTVGGCTEYAMDGGALWIDDMLRTSSVTESKGFISTCSVISIVTYNQILAPEDAVVSKFYSTL
jgi:hypothetical protein